MNIRWASEDPQASGPTTAWVKWGKVSLSTSILSSRDPNIWSRSSSSRRAPCIDKRQIRPAREIFNKSIVILQKYSSAFWTFVNQFICKRYDSCQTVEIGAIRKYKQILSGSSLPTNRCQNWILTSLVTFLPGVSWCMAETTLWHKKTCDT